MPTIRVKIDKFGQPTIEAEGYTGTSCEHATATLEAALRHGASSVTKQRRPEYRNEMTNNRTVTSR